MIYPPALQPALLRVHHLLAYATFLHALWLSGRQRRTLFIGKRLCDVDNQTLLPKERLLGSQEQLLLRQDRKTHIKSYTESRLVSEGCNPSCSHARLSSQL